MKKHLKRILVLMVVLALSLTSLDNSVAFAQEDKSILELDKSNYTYIKGKLGDTSVIYTYTSDNKTFKVIEKASVNFDDVDSIIYIKSSNGQFVEYATQTLSVKDDVIYITINENGRITTDTINIYHEKTSGIENPPNQSNGGLNSMSGPSWNGLPVDTTWHYYGTFNGDNNIVRYTSSAVLAILATIAASMLGIAGQCVVAGVSAIASIIIDDAIEQIWWTDYVYYQTVIPPEDWMLRRKVAEKSSTYVYSSSSKSSSDLIGNYTYTYYEDGYEF